MTMNRNELLAYLRSELRTHFPGTVFYDELGGRTQAGLNHAIFAHYARPEIKVVFPNNVEVVETRADVDAVVQMMRDSGYR
jgi:hypothetical protein